MPLQCTEQDSSDRGRLVRKRYSEPLATAERELELEPELL
jgi:hypothetical protein